MAPNTSDKTRPDSIYRPNPAVSTRRTGDRGALLYHADTGRKRYLNDTGLFVWSLVDGSLTTSDIAVRLQREFNDAPLQSVHDDIAAFLQEMDAQHFVGRVSTPVETQPIPRPKNQTPFPDETDAPTSFDLSMTGKCNLHCAYCYYDPEMKNRPDLPTADWITFFRELKQLSVQDVCLSGGEVFVRPDIWELIDGVIEGRMRYSILTNGTLVTEKILEHMETGKRKQRLNYIQVSIDGSCADIHDKSRTRGSFEKAVRGLRLLLEAGFPALVRVTINRHNVDDLENIARLLLEEIGVHSFTTNDAMPMGAGCANQENILLTAKQQITAMRTMVRLADIYDGRISATAGPMAKWRTYQEMERARATGEMPSSWKMGYLTACGCTYSKLAVNHDGSITPCSILGGLVLGQINQDGIAKIWKSHPTLAALKQRRSIPMGDVPGCNGCEWASFCNGSCPGLAYAMTGDFNRSNQHDCYRRFLQENGGRSPFDPIPAP